MTRSKMFQIRFAATTALLVLAWLLARYVWFPGDYFALSDLRNLLLILVAANLIVGPGLSTLLYRPGKWGLRFDLIVIAIVEIAILCWCMLEIYERRPAFAVFAVDRFEAVAESEVDLSMLADNRIEIRMGIGPQLVYAALPTDPEVMTRLIDETLFEGKKDIDRRPEFWKPYAEGLSLVMEAGLPLARLLHDEDSRNEAVRRWLEKRGAAANDYRYMPMRGRSADGIVIIDVASGYPQGVLAVDPWLPVIDPAVP